MKHQNVHTLLNNPEILQLIKRYSDMISAGVRHGKGTVKLNDPNYYIIGHINYALFIYIYNKNKSTVLYNVCITISYPSEPEFFNITIGDNRTKHDITFDNRNTYLEYVQETSMRSCALSDTGTPEEIMFNLSVQSDYQKCKLQKEFILDCIECEKLITSAVQ